MAKETLKDVKTVETAENKAEVVQEQASKKERKAPQESVYSVDELAANAKEIFGTRQECVATALRSDEKKGYTVPEAKRILEKFLKREVK